MPQAPDHLRAKFADDSAAFEALGFNFFCLPGGVIYPKEGYVPNAHEWDAIDYLIMEWDYGYSSEPVRETS